MSTHTIHMHIRTNDMACFNASTLLAKDSYVHIIEFYPSEVNNTFAVKAKCTLLTLTILQKKLYELDIYVMV